MALGFVDAFGKVSPGTNPLDLARARRVSAGILRIVKEINVFLDKMLTIGDDIVNDHLSLE